MSVRPFDWRDISFLQRNRHQAVFLDSALVLTRGPMLISGALLSYLVPALGLFTSVYSGGDDHHQPMICQMIHMLGTQSARLIFLAPDATQESSAAPALLEYMIMLAGERGAQRLLAEVDENTEAFDVLRHNGFAIYTRQKVWRLLVPLSDTSQSTDWRAASSRDTIAIRSLYHCLAPGFVQQAEPFNPERPKGIVYYRKGELLAYAELRYGHRGIWVQPFVHPDAQDVSDHIISLLIRIPNRFSRPIYICVRSYQAWLESALEEQHAEPGPRQAVMVKYLAISQKAGRAFALPSLDSGQPEVSSPIARSENTETLWNNAK